MKKSEHGYVCEGYWDEKYNKPVASKFIWEGKEEWLKKAYIVNNNVDFHNYRGMSPSRIKKDNFVGSGEYNDKTRKICWPEGYVEHYIEENNVLPSQNFYEYINEKYESIPNYRRFPSQIRR